MEHYQRTIPSPQGINQKQRYIQNLLIGRKAVSWLEQQTSAHSATRRVIQTQAAGPIAWVWRLSKFVVLATTIAQCLPDIFAFDGWCYAPSAVLLVIALCSAMIALISRYSLLVSPLCSGFIAVAFFLFFCALSISFRPAYLIAAVSALCFALVEVLLFAVFAIPPLYHVLLSALLPASLSKSMRYLHRLVQPHTLRHISSSI